MNHVKLAILLVVVALSAALSSCGRAPVPAAEVAAAEPDTLTFTVDPTPEQLAVAQPERRATIELLSLTPETRPLVSGTDISAANVSYAFLPNNTLTIRVRFKNIRDELSFAQRFRFRAKSSNIISSTEPAVRNADLGGDGVLSPGETTSVLEFTVRHRGRPFSYQVTAEALVTPTNPGAKLVPDPVLETTIRTALSKPEGELTVADLQRLKSVAAPNFSSPKKIKSLRGLEHAVNLIELNLDSNAVSDLSPIAGLTSLQMLDIDFNAVTDLKPVAGLTSLTDLYARTNAVTSAAPLRALTKLQFLDLQDNPLGTLQGLESLTSLTFLLLDETGVSDLGPLAPLTNLNRLSLRRNSVSNLGPLAKHSKLAFLSLDENRVSNLRPLRTLTALEGLDLNDNNISDIAPLVANRGLGEGDFVELLGNRLDLAPQSQDRRHIQQLQARGVEVLFQLFDRNRQGLTLAHLQPTR